MLQRNVLAHRVGARLPPRPMRQRSIDTTSSGAHAAGCPATWSLGDMSCTPQERAKRGGGMGETVTFKIIRDPYPASILLILKKLPEP